MYTTVYKFYLFGNIIITIPKRQITDPAMSNLSGTILSIFHPKIINKTIKTPP